MTNNLPAQRSGYGALSPQQRQDHRQKIGVRAQAILGQFWRDDETPEAIQALEMEGWMDVLEGCSHSEIRKAWAKYQIKGPRTKSGKLYKPDAGAIYKLVVDARPLPPPPAHIPAPVDEEPERIPCDPETAQAIVDAAGFRVKRFGGQGDG